MARGPLVSTSTEGLRPLGTAAQRSFELVTGTVAATLGPEHATLFAEPVATDHGDRIDWYAALPGEPVALPDLPEDEQAVLRDRLGRLVADIRAEADTLAASDDAQDQRLSEALRNAIEVPDETMVFALRDEAGALQPVLAHWAWLRDAQQSVRGVLTAMVPRPVAPTAQGASTGQATDGGSDESRGGSAAWWWLILLGWLLLAALLAFILYLVIAPCGLNGGRLIFCPAPEEAVSAIPGERAVIEDEIAGLRRELTLLDRSCQPTIPILPATPGETAPEAPAQPNLPAFPAPGAAPAPAPQDDTTLTPEAVGRQLVERGARRGELNFALSWSTTDDIDLTVACPTGQVLSHSNRSDCNGIYDLDANVRRAEAVTDPVENVVFDEVIEGVYQVRALLKGNRTVGDKTVTLHVLRQDGRSQTYSGKVGDNAPEWAVNISISR